MQAGQLGAVAQPHIPPVVTGARSDHWINGLRTKGMLWVDIILLRNTVIDKHSLRKLRAKAESSVISATFSSLLIFSTLTNGEHPMHPNAPTSVFTVTGILHTNQAPSLRH